MAPKIATPIALPAERAKMVRPVTTPRSFQSTDAWAAISEGAAVQPSPKPVTNDATPTVQGLGWGPLAASPTVPATAIIEPMSTVVRYPYRRYSLPASEADNGQPRVSAAAAAPDTRGTT